MEKDLRILNDLKQQIEKGRTNYRKSPKERITEEYVSSRLEVLDKTFSKLQDKHESLVTKYSAGELEDTEYIKNDSLNSVCETYFLYKSEMKIDLKELLSSTVSNGYSNGSACETQSNVRLPQICIPQFSGKYTEWMSFKDLFMSLIHNNKNIDDVQRLHYLKTSVKGEAEQLLKHIPITGNNYYKCWETLQNRYDNKKFISNCILKRLFSQSTLKYESSKGLKELIDTVTDCLHELQGLGIDVKSWDVIIIYMVSSKLDAESRKQWELFINNSSSVDTNLPTFAQFKDFLECRFRALEYIEPVPNKLKSNITKVLHVTSNTNTTLCPHCRDNHKLHLCNKFSKEDVTSRQAIVRALGLCFNCLGSGHTGKYCRVSLKCRICKSKHHTMLHGKPTKLEVAAVREESGCSVGTEPSIETRESESIISNHFVTGEVCGQTLLATALVRAESTNGYSQILRGLLDQGSQASFISEAAVQLLQLKKVKEKSSISCLGGGSSNLTSKYVVQVNIQSLYDPTFKLQVKAHVLNTVTSILPEKKFILPEWSDLGQINLADPNYNSPNKIDILLGSEVYCSILKKGLIKSPYGLTIAQDTYLGWVLSGQVRGYDDGSHSCHNIILNLHVQVEENDMLKKFWELESEPSSLQAKILTPEEQACEKHYEATTSRDDTGRYIVKLPFRPNVEPNYGDTRMVAVKRLLSLEKRLSKNVDLKLDYSQVLTEYLTLGHMEEVPRSLENHKSVWLPHHAVIRLDKSTTKTRVVFNASDKSANGVSLNDTLMVGPMLQPDLRHLIMRWRQHPICLTADIIKMYRQIKVAEDHADFQRIVWRDSDNEDIHDYRLLTVTFGTSSAPYLAVKTLQQIAIDEGQNYPMAASRIKTDYFMDDLLSGCQTEEEAIILYKEMNELLSKGGFTLQKWASNKMGLLETLKENAGQDREFREDEVTKVVGLIWNRRTDEFDYCIKLSSDSSVPETKRQIISEICRLYDPIGWISPCIIISKIFIQKLWITGLDWDDKLPEELVNEWKSYREELFKLVDFHIPRWVQTSHSDTLMELHGFSDASSAAYAAVVYVRCITADGKIETHLVTAKTKVAPIKQISIPRLELCGAVLVTRLLCEVAEVLNVDKCNLHAWTDSTIVLAWLSDHPSRWKTFVANRTSEILNLLDSSQWSYIQSKDNPADCASRGLLPSELVENKLWKYGPDWLHSDSIPYGKPISICSKTDLETKLIKVHTASLESENVEDTDIITRYSSLRRLIRVVAYCRRFLRLKNSTVNRMKNLPYLSASELQDSLTCCIQQHQARWFHEEIANILKHKNVNKSKLSTLNPFIDQHGILRVGGRIVNSDLPASSKHPIIVYGGSHLAKLIIRNAHERTLHGGQQLTCNYIRSRYWITKMKNVVRAEIHNCIPCVRNAAKIRNQLMGQLPSCRVTPHKPFLHSGVDYAGPINIRVSKGRGYKSYKGYICLFICMATRAVHIEAVSDLTSEGFLTAFKRFIARRGRCLHLWSDNGTNFVGASKELKILFSSERSLLSNEVASSLANNGTEWHFIPPHAPHFGGLWEAGIKSTKHHLRRVIGDSTLTYEELATVLAQIEACLNSRPLSLLSTNPDDPEPLTPGHFLVGEPVVIAPDHNYEQMQISNLRRWQLTQRMIQNFWKRWSEEYLTNFFQRYKWKNKAPELKVDDVVLVRDENLPPTKWLYGRIVKVHPGKDQIVRVVTLKYKY